MADLIEQSKQLVQLQIELERLKNGADTIQEFSTSALRALEFVNQSQSDYQQTKEALGSLEHHVNELKGALEDSQLRTILSDIATAIDRLEASNTELKTQIDVITERLDHIKVEVGQLASFGESKVAELVIQLEGLQTQGQVSDKKLADSIADMQTGLDQKIRSLGGMSNKLIKNVDTNSAKSYRELENLNKLMRVALILIVIAIVVDLLPTILGLF